MDLKKKQMIRYLSKCVGEKRIIHSKNTAKEAVKLAKKYGADEKKAYIAGLLHDVAKGKCRFGLRNLAKEYDLDIDEYEMRNPELTHGKLGAIMVNKQLGIKDKRAKELALDHGIKVIMDRCIMREHKRYLDSKKKTKGSRSGHVK